MNSLVSNEINFIAKAFPTITALITLFYSVNALVWNEEIFAVKACPTNTVQIRFPFCGNPSMWSDLPTLATLMKPFSGTGTLPLIKVLIVESSLFTLMRCMTSSTVSGLPTLTATAWALSDKSGLELEKAGDGWKFRPNILTRERRP